MVTTGCCGACAEPSLAHRPFAASLPAAASVGSHAAPCDAEAPLPLPLHSTCFRLLRHSLLMCTAAAAGSAATGCAAADAAAVGCHSMAEVGRCATACQRVTADLPSSSATIMPLLVMRPYTAAL